MMLLGVTSLPVPDVVGIRTIGDLACSDPVLLKYMLGKNGLQLWAFANGRDTSRVMDYTWRAPVKSIGHGITCVADLENNWEVWRVLLQLAQGVGSRLRENGLAARGVQITVRNNRFVHQQFQAKTDFPTQCALELARAAQSLFEEHYEWYDDVRSITIRAIDLVGEKTPVQLDMFGDTALHDRQERLESAMHEIRSRFGRDSVRPASLLGDLKMPVNRDNMPMAPFMSF